MVWALLCFNEFLHSSDSVAVMMMDCQEPAAQNVLEAMLSPG